MNSIHHGWIGTSPDKRFIVSDAPALRVEHKMTCLNLGIAAYKPKDNQMNVIMKKECRKLNQWKQHSVRHN